MKPTVVFLTTMYLQYASDEALRAVAERARLVLIVPRGAPVDPRLAPYFARVETVDAALDANVRPPLDEDAVLAIVRDEIARAGSPDALRIFCQEEFNLLTAARVRVRCGIPGDEPALVERFRNKLTMKAAVAAAGLRVPRYEPLDLARTGPDASGPYFAELSARLGTPLVVKPVDAGGSLNVAVVRDEAEFGAACRTIRGSKYPFAYEVDAFVAGTLYQCDSLTRDGRVVFRSVLELGCANFEFVLGRPLSVYPVPESGLRARLERFDDDVIAALGFRDGATHHEIFHDPVRDELVFLEIAARIAGGLAVPYHQLNSNMNFIDAVLYQTAAPALLDRVQARSRDNVVSALLPVGHGTIVKLNEPRLESRYEIRWAVRPGQTVDARSLADNAGILMVYNDDRAALRRDFERLADYVPLEVR